MFIIPINCLLLSSLLKIGREEGAVKFSMDVKPRVVTTFLRSQSNTEQQWILEGEEVGAGEKCPDLVSTRLF